MLPPKNNIFDFINSRGHNAMQRWANGMPMQKKDRGRLDNRIDLLERTEDGFCPRLLHPTTKRCKHIMHLVVRGQVTFSLMLCRGPATMNNEFTFLFGATERDRKYNPQDAPERADRNRDDLISNPNRRCKHERFSKDPETII